MRNDLTPSTFVLYGRSIAFYLGIVAALMVFMPLSLPLALVRYPVRYQIMTHFAHFFLWWLDKTCHLTYEVKGLENIPKDKPVIVLSKHQSAWETIAYAKILPFMQVWVLKKELLWIPLFGWGLATMRPIAIERTNVRRSLEQIIDQGRKRLANGISVIIFPEGTRVAPNERGRYTVSGALLAEKSGFSVLPIAHNAGVFWRRQGFLKYPGVIQVSIGTLIKTEGKTAKVINTQAEEWIENEMKKLVHDDVVTNE
ncbi:lysophospholipid acyltransferase family protein [Beggiatoa leptomitoformis]|uniref:1-acyl-sn-glycerol-3-phosphate acyltransferase n=1 Tax=Beggiatoa leptomitoformis TaxID=288004 RepID=A0A2N9YI05_9GAMM|nr:lysophospholipid acyltransferase family protein [Beggiatoa leptomitoformis]ALG67735.1 1-acyl-sn-glycerol-3-phosphate acyltransferase [Beggiatoa leptomitoformis]AUI70025.1 1-acyl-sn-glycerol-3-phosphate acyltransferase [Beggiatoa leptomitoformis]